MFEYGKMVRWFDSMAIKPRCEVEKPVLQTFSQAAFLPWKNYQIKSEAPQAYDDYACYPDAKRISSHFVKA
jgi:hypothetical protein